MELAIRLERSTCGGGEFRMAPTPRIDADSFEFKAHRLSRHAGSPLSSKWQTLSGASNLVWVYGFFSEVVPLENLDDVAQQGSGLDMSLREAMSTQRAIRRLKSDPVDLDLIRQCLELAVRAPTGGNEQNWEFIVITDPKVKRKLQRMYKLSFGAYAPIVRRQRHGDEAMQKIFNTVEAQVEHFDEVPVIVVACLRGSILRWMPPFMPFVPSSFYGSIYPAVQNFLLALRAIGLGASLTTLPLWSAVASRRILRLPFSTVACCVIPIGWPEGHYGPTTRKPVTEVSHLNRYGNPH